MGKAEPKGTMSSPSESEASTEATRPPRIVIEYLHQHVFQSREILVGDLSRFGIDPEREGFKMLRWGPENNWRMDREALDFLTPEEFAAIIEADPSLVLKEI